MVGPETKEVASYVLLALLFGIGGWLLLDRDALRDDSRQKDKPFSLARVQLWWWTLIVLGAEFALYGVHGAFWPFNTTCLTLLGISAVTTAAGRVIDDRQEREPGIERVQNTVATEGFWRDILSDEHGLSVHRYQTVMFNIAYGVAFLLDTFSKGSLTFPTFDPTTLALLGVSSGAYVAMKANENANVPVTGKSQPTASDELVDAEPAAPTTP